MPLYVLELLGMPRRLERYTEAGWQPLLIVSAIGALLIFSGILLLIWQLVVSVENRKDLADLTGDPWNGRTLEWLTSSPPASYNFAVLPAVAGRDAFFEMKSRNVAPLTQSCRQIRLADPTRSRFSA